ncbi:MAG: hypothetical protein AB8G11_22085 [Saprospiraceae bacterium]
MTQKIFIIGLIISFLGLSVSGCFTPDDIKLTEAQKKQYIDSVYQLEYKRLQPIMDENCEDNFDKLVNRAVDSLINVYLDSTKYDY